MSAVNTQYNIMCNKKVLFSNSNKPFFNWVFEFFNYNFCNFLIHSDDMDFDDIFFYTKRVFTEIIIKSLSIHGLRNEYVYDIICASFSLSLKCSLGYDWLYSYDMIPRIVDMMNNASPIKVNVKKVLETERSLLYIALNLKSIKRTKL